MDNTPLTGIYDTWNSQVLLSDRYPGFPKFRSVERKLDGSETIRCSTRTPCLNSQPKDSVPPEHKQLSGPLDVIGPIPR